MGYKSLNDCLLDLEKNGQLRRVTEEVDPNLQLAAIHRRVYQAKGPALLFENIKGSSFRAASNLFGTVDRTHFLFRDTIEAVKRIIALKGDPAVALKKPFSHLGIGWQALKALPKKQRSGPVLHGTCNISDLPQLKCWPMDGGPFITLPQVYTEDPEAPGIMKANLGMYRIQLGGNDYIQDKEIGLHYQIHRGIGVHQAKANGQGKPLKVSIFVGGPPSHTLSAVMPLPEGISEATFAGLIGNRRYRHTYRDGYCLATDADFVITGEINPAATKSEGPFGDHLGYYSLEHNFPVMQVHKVYHRKNAIWPFTVVGRPPQEDTAFGHFIHELTGTAIQQTIPGVKAVNAVDEAGVHPLLLAIGSERYTPYSDEYIPSEILTQANAILGFGQLSLAKYLFITMDATDVPKIADIPAFFQYMLERIDLKRDLHFQTQTTIDTLDYSGTGLNRGSKLVIAAPAGQPIRKLAIEKPITLRLPTPQSGCALIAPGILAVEGKAFQNHEEASAEIHDWLQALADGQPETIKTLADFPLIIYCDDAAFTAANFSNFLWVTFTRSNPSHDIYGLNEKFIHKHWGCDGTLLIDARKKPHHAPELVTDPTVEASVDSLGAKGSSLYGLI